MKRLLFVGICLLGLGACASLPVQKNCAQGKIMPSFFTDKNTLAAFYMQANWKEYEVEGILQIRKLNAEQYEVSAFSTAGGYRLMQAIVTPDHTQYSFLIKPADKAIVRGKLQRLWELLLFQPQRVSRCQQQDGKTYLTYAKPFARRYVYQERNKYPEQAISKTFLHRSVLSFNQYQQVENEQVPQQLTYQEGGVTVALQLIRLK